MKNDSWVKSLAENLNKNVILEDEWTKSLVPRALNFAMRAHQNQIRKADGFSYIVHSICVAILVAKVLPNDYAIAGGLLHDTVEDTNAKLEEIEKEFGCATAKIVENLTEKDKNLPWRERKMLALAEIKEMDEWSLIVKACDKIHNARSLYSVFLEKGEEVISKFNAKHLKEQLEMEKFFYKELEKNFKKFEFLQKNSLLEELKIAIEDLEKVKVRHALIAK